MFELFSKGTKGKTKMNGYIESVSNDLATIGITLAIIILASVILFMIYIVCHRHNQKKMYRIVQTADDMFRIQKYTDTNITRSDVNGNPNGNNF